MDVSYTKSFQGVPISILDTTNIVVGGNANETFMNSLDLAQKAEDWGYYRFWLTEHHNIPAMASAATSVVMGYIAAGTKRIRVGSGGIMLSNHAPLVIAEQFGTLESMYPGRIDLGLGRAPGSDSAASAALRRDHTNGEDFPELLRELRGYFRDDALAKVRAYPGTGLAVPIWLLGSSDFSARLAAELGLPFSFANHVAADFTIPAVRLYRQLFKPSSVLSKPHVMVGMNVTVADSNERAHYLASTQKQMYLAVLSGRMTPLMPPVEDMSQVASEAEIFMLERNSMYRSLTIGDPDHLKTSMQKLIRDTQPDEIIMTTQIFHHKDRLRNFEIIAELLD
ncbi:LLM class flavin-dependent oxidoreductase [Paenibacillus qinlingensis]|uniref:Luciferase family oxidoreductase group 1 n=1 Tax=Paenibacillus qinlingensis TaxID=1837343 RepID=A0ABU1NS94_9BACL|nr:LLM class flavin-dependent oxidoreductase [Paenibacillus qinlingensis]MDR6550353.1 luciferase family oxidoreductase group 1 [Paenibacillus qinlingensis]